MIENKVTALALIANTSFMQPEESILDDIAKGQTLATGFQRFLINLTDGAIYFLIIAGFYFLVPRDFLVLLFDQHIVFKYLLLLSMTFGYRLICHLLFGRTLGMIFSSSKYLNSKELPLTGKEKLLAVFMTKPLGIRYYKL